MVDPDPLTWIGFQEDCVITACASGPCYFRCGSVRAGTRVPLFFRPHLPQITQAASPCTLGSQIILILECTNENHQATFAPGIDRESRSMRVAQRWQRCQVLHRLCRVRPMLPMMQPRNLSIMLILRAHGLHISLGNESIDDAALHRPQLSNPSPLLTEPKRLIAAGKLKSINPRRLRIAN